MAIFTAIGTAIAGAIFGGSVLAATLISGALAFGARALLGRYLGRQKQRKYSAVQGEVQFGGDQPASTVFGTTQVKGQRIYYAKHGRGNKYNSEVFVLANGWCDGLEPEVWFYGKKHTLKLVAGKRPVEDFARYAPLMPQHSNIGSLLSALVDWNTFNAGLSSIGIDLNSFFVLLEQTLGMASPQAAFGNASEVWNVEGFDDKISIRFYDGRPGQQADLALIADTANLDNKWLATDTCAGMAYVVVEREWDEDLFDKGRPEMGFVLRGLREYDFRKDSTVAGGSGPQRINDPATWAHSLNPAVHRLNYQLGLKGLISGRTVIGEGKTLGQLDLDSYRAAMNVCDTLREGKPTYQASLWVTADDDHTEVLKEFDDAMAGYGMNRRGLSGVIAGAPQIPVYSIDDDDIDDGRPKSIKRRKSAFDLHNHLSGQYTSKEAGWSAESLKPITVNADVAADGRVRQVSNDFLQVTDPDIAQYLLQIRYRQNRKGGSATVPVSRRAGLAIMEGEWVSYAGSTWLVTNWLCDEDFRFTLTLAETGSDVYSSGGIVPGPVIVPTPPPINPGLLSTVLDFAVEVGSIDGADGHEIPVLRFSWSPPADPSIVAVRFEYFTGTDPSGQTICRDQTDDAEAGVYVTSKDVVGGKHYTARATIVTRPDRFKSWTAWVTTVAATPPYEVYPPGLIEQIETDVRDMLDWLDEDSPINPLGDQVAATAAALLQEVTDRAAAVTAEASARTAQIATERAERLGDASRHGRWLRDLSETLSRTTLQVNDAILAAARERTTIRNEVTLGDQGVRAYSLEQLDLAVGPTSALVARLIQIEADIDTAELSLSAAVTTLEEAIADGDAGEASARQALALQVRGSYSGNDITLITEGLLYQERQTRISEDSALATSISLVAAGVGILFDWAKHWSFDTSVESWTGNGAPAAAAGYLRPADHASDPHVISPSGLAVVATAYSQVKAYVRKTGSPVWEGYCWYKRTGDGTWDAGRRATISEPTFDGSGRAVVTWDLDWDGTIDQIRVDLSAAQTATDYYRIDWIDIGRPSPGASQAQVGAVQSALATLISAEATSREALSAVLTGLTDPTGATLGSLSSGLVFDERTARVSGDAANASLISGVQAALDLAEGDIGTLATAQSALSAAISAVEGNLSLAASDIADIEAALPGKASTAVTDALTASIATLTAGAAATLMAQAIRDLQLTVDRVALGQSDLYVQGQRDRIELAGATTAVNQSMTSRIDSTDTSLTLLGDIVNSIALTVPSLATLTITDALTGRVTAAELEQAAQGSSITAIQAALAGYSGSGAVATAILSLTGAVTTAQTTADGRNKVFKQATAPTALAAGDLWIDSDDSNKLYRATAAGAGSWDLSDDQRVPTLVTQMSSASSAIIALQNDLDVAEAAISTKAAQSALDSLTSTVTSQGGLVSSQGAAITALQGSLTTTNSNVSAAQAAADAAATLAGSKGKVIVQTAAPDVGDRLPQNLWIDITGAANTPKRWNGSAWAAVTDKVATDAAAAAASALSTLTTKADATALNSLQTQVNTVETTANGRNRVFRQGTAPSATAVGDLWLHSGEGNKLYRATAAGTGGWVAVDDQRIPDLVTLTSSQGASLTSLSNSLTTTNGNVTAAQAAADAAAALAGSKGKVIVQSAAPDVADRLAQNLWIDTTSNANTPKRWNGSSWAAVTDKVATDAAAAAASALSGLASKADASALTTLQTQVNTVETTANGRNRVFRQSTAPSATAIGDLWFDTANGNKVFRASATGTGSWVATDDERIATVVSGLSSTSSSVTALQNALSGYTGSGAVGAALATKASTSALAALESSVTAIDGEVDALASAQTAVAAALNTVSADAKIKFEAVASPGGGWSRIGLRSRVSTGDSFAAASLFLDAKSDGSSRIVMDAQKFWIGDLSAGAVVNPLIYDTGQWRMNVANIGTITAGVLQAPDGKFIIDLSAGSLEWFE